MTNSQTTLPPPMPNKDTEHLKLLTIFHYVVSGICALCSIFPLIYVALGAVFVISPESMDNGRNGAPPPDWFGYFFIIFGLVGFIAAIALAIGTLVSGRYMAKRRKRMFSFVMAAILCIFMPFGTVLGIFTILVLNRESVQRLYMSESNASGHG